jgi:hypothetical protein
MYLNFNAVSLELQFLNRWPWPSWVLVAVDVPAQRICWVLYWDLPRLNSWGVQMQSINFIHVECSYLYRSVCELPQIQSNPILVCCHTFETSHVSISIAWPSAIHSKDREMLLDALYSYERRDRSAVCQSSSHTFLLDFCQQSCHSVPLHRGHRALLCPQSHSALWRCRGSWHRISNIEP